MPGRLADKVCLITGAASGQGRVASQLFARESALLVLADIDTEGLEETARLVRQEGGDAALYAGDLTREEPNREMVDLALQRHGRVNSLYNAAGLVRFAPAHEMSLEDWHYTIEYELTITFLGCKHALRAMVDRGSGSIVNVSSLSGFVHGTPSHAAHAATKAGIAGLTRQIAVEYGPHGIRCNAIAPSYLVYEPGQRRVAAQSGTRSAESIPLRRHCRPEDTAQAAIYLVSDESSFVTGQILIVDGGASLR